MKYLLVVLLLSLLAAVIVSAKPRRTGRAGYGSRHGHHSSRHDYDRNDSDDNDNDDNDDDDSDDDDEKAASDAQMCFIGLMTCYQSLEKFQPTPNITDFISNIHQIGARETCKELRDYGDCVDSALQVESCEDSLPDEVKRISRQGLELLDYVCVDRLDELESHWDCYLNPTIFEELGENEREIGRDLEECKTDALITSVDEAFSKIPECSSGASDLVEDFVKRVMDIVPHCSDKKKIARAIMHMFRKK